MCCIDRLSSQVLTRLIRMFKMPRRVGWHAPGGGCHRVAAGRSACRCPGQRVMTRARTWVPLGDNARDGDDGCHQTRHHHTPPDAPIPSYTRLALRMMLFGSQQNCNPRSGEVFCNQAEEPHNSGGTSKADYVLREHCAGIAPKTQARSPPSAQSAPNF